jgi:hypothetical protein
MLKTVIIDGYGNQNKAKVNGEGELSVVVHPHPPKDEAESPLPVREYFKTSAGSSDMAVDGSTTAVEFSINSQANFDVYIRTASIVIADASQTLQEFGNLNAALTNGVKLEWRTSDLGTVVIHDGLKTNFDFIRLALGNPSLGDGASAFLASNAIPTNIEAYLPVVDFSQVFGLPWGLRLRAGTTDKVVWTVQDNVSAVDQFDIIGYGIKI